MDKKFCTQCGEEKPLDQFHSQKGAKDGRHSWCKVCANARHQAHRNESKDARQRQNYKRRYGLTPEEIRLMIAEQHNRCPICGVKLMDQYRVDHDHKNGNVRAILCHRCNLLIAGIEDTEFLTKAVEYLARFQ